MSQVVVLARSFSRGSNEPRELLSQAGLEVVFKKNPEPEKEGKVAELIGDAEAVIVGVDRIGEVVFSRCSNLRVVSKHGVGVDNIDLEAAKRHGVVVANAPGTNSQSVADMAFLLILACARGLPILLEQVKNKVWSSPFLGVELEDKVLGIVGLGRIGKEVGKRGQGFGMKVIYYDPVVEDKEFASVSLEDLFKSADFVSLHAPLTKDTEKMVGEKLLSLMKEEAFLINTARGELVDEEALYRFLQEKRIKGAALDVLTFEPPFESPLLSLPNVIVTPHVSAHTKEANIKMGRIAALNVIRVLQGEEPLYRVV
ncbi:phosphoglycerate dehydrogenase [Candidatus Sordicultor fermentans]|uniref:phosphoglycerate dehydrogenase n=1 Tax=Candidatus Sordicultor fermentans TaxID=1953203 RepID=UPI0016ADDD13|nr:phosphoglycerate dehydrogenase [Candidatus Atribacteria bacterium]